MDLQRCLLPVQTEQKIIFTAQLVSFKMWMTNVLMDCADEVKYTCAMANWYNKLALISIPQWLSFFKLPHFLYFLSQNARVDLVPLKLKGPEAGRKILLGDLTWALLVSKQVFPSLLPSKLQLLWFTGSWQGVLSFSVLTNYFTLLANLKSKFSVVSDVA